MKKGEKRGKRKRVKFTLVIIKTNYLGNADRNKNVQNGFYFKPSSPFISHGKKNCRKQIFLYFTRERTRTIAPVSKASKCAFYLDNLTLEIFSKNINLYTLTS